jgi:hypothetical protein
VVVTLKFTLQSFSHTDVVSVRLEVVSVRIDVVSVRLKVVSVRIDVRPSPP